MSTHLDHVETAFSFRTRILDYFWASVPVVATEGDALADLIDQSGGITVPPGDVDALEDALFRILDDDELAAVCRKNLAELAPEFTWTRVLEPLLRFCRAPRRAPDLVRADTETLRVQLPGALRSPATPRTLGDKLREDAAVARTYLRSGGLKLVVWKAWRRLRRLAGRPAS